MTPVRRCIDCPSTLVGGTAVRCVWCERRAKRASTRKIRYPVIEGLALGFLRVLITVVFIACLGGACLLLLAMLTAITRALADIAPWVTG